jgi:hypothetical protein
VDSRVERRTLGVWARLKPEGFVRFFSYLDSVFDPEQGRLPVVERRLIATVVSAENRAAGIGHRQPCPPVLRRLCDAERDAAWTPAPSLLAGF